MDLEERGQAVITRMRGIPALSHLPVDDLPSIPLGLLRRSATRCTRSAGTEGARASPRE